MGGAEAPQRARIEAGAGEIAVRTRVLPIGRSDARACAA